MSNVLTKDITVGRPGVPSSPGTPPVSPSPAYCLDVSGTRLVTRVVFIPIFDPATGAFTGDYIQLYTSVWVPYIDHVCYPASGGSPGTPPSAGIPATATSYHQGWNSSATSIDSLTGDGIYQFSTPGGTIGIVVGFNDANVGSGYIEIEHGIYVDSAQYQIMEGGVAKTASAPCSSATVFSIVRLGGLVMYFEDSTLVYTSLARSTGTVFVDCSMYFGGDKIQ